MSGLALLRNAQPPFACSFMCCSGAKDECTRVSTIEEKVPRPNAPGLKDIIASPWPGAKEVPAQLCPCEIAVSAFPREGPVTSRASASVAAEEDASLGSDSSSEEEDGAAGSCTIQNRSSHVLEVLLWKEPTHCSKTAAKGVMCAGTPRVHAPMLREARRINAGAEVCIFMRGTHAMACGFHDETRGYFVFRRKGVCRVGSTHCFNNSHYIRAVESDCACMAKTLPQALAMYDGILQQGDDIVATAP
jgi:hypothetical protein